MSRKYRKKPVVIEACRWTGQNGDEMAGFMGRPLNVANRGGGESVLLIVTLEGTMTADPGDWIIRGIRGEYYPCKPDVFEKTYEHVPDAPYTPPCEACKGPCEYPHHPIGSLDGVAKHIIADTP